MRQKQGGSATHVGRGLHLRWTTSLLVLGCVLLIAVPLAIAQSADEPPFTLSWWTVDGGGTTYSTGGGYTLGGTVGQPDAGVLEGHGYVLGGGFWRGGKAPPPGYEIYLPVVLRRSW